MDERALFTKFWEHEAKTTSKVIARIPESSDYRPDPKSRTAKDIAWQIACEEKMIIEAIETGKVEGNPPAAPATMKDLVEIYDTQSADIVRRWKALPAERWDGSLDFFGKQRPASPMAWSFLFDIVHHRGQITTYLRPMGSTVPQIYGPSAAEPESRGGAGARVRGCAGAPVIPSGARSAPPLSFRAERAARSRGIR